MKLKKVRLKDISVDNKGKYGIGASAVDYDKEKYTYLRITDINDNGGLNCSDMKSVDDPEAYKYILKDNDIVFARTGNSTGKAYFYDGAIPNLVFAGFLIKFTLDNSKVNPRFLKYYTLTNEYWNWVKSIQTGSTRGNINAEMYGNMEITLLERKYQDKIVKILSTLDNKIELNNQTNDNLLFINYLLLDK